MRRSIALAALLAALAPPAARAEHAKLTLEIHAPGGKQETAFVDQTPPASGKNPRPVLKVKAGDALKVKWVFTNVYPHKTLEHVVMHFYVAKIDKVGQKDLPALDDDVELETAFDMDFKPGAKAGARARLTLDEPGVYLVRVESKETGSDHEHFAAIDVVVER